MRAILITSFLLSMVFSGCSLVELENFDPRGSVVAVKGYFLIDDQIPTEEFCESANIQDVRLEFYAGSKMVRHPELEFRCTDHVFETDSILKYGLFRVRWVAYDTAGSEVAVGPYFYLDALKTDPSVDEKVTQLAAGRLYSIQGSFFPFGEDVNFSTGWTIDGASSNLDRRCEELGISTIEISFFQPNEILLSDRRVVGVSPCSRGTYSLILPLIKSGRYQYTVRALGEGGAVLFESPPEIFDAKQDEYFGLGPVNIESVSPVQDFVLSTLWQSVTTEDMFLICQNAQVDRFRVELIHQRTGEVVNIMEQSCEQGPVVLKDLPQGEAFDVVLSATSNENPSFVWKSVCGRVSVEGEQASGECEISYQGPR